MAEAPKLVKRLLEGADDPSDFDVEGHLQSPLTRLAKVNGFERQDRHKGEERWIKKLKQGEAWLLATAASPEDFVRKLDPTDPVRQGGRHWRFMLVKAAFKCAYCHTDRPRKNCLCPHCKKSHEILSYNDIRTLAEGSELTMNYLLGAILQRLATWPKGLPKPGTPGWNKALESVDDPPSDEHLARMGRAGECEELCPRCGAYCTLRHYHLPSGVQMPQYHICQTCDTKSADTMVEAKQSLIPTLKRIVDVWAHEDWDWVCDGCADVSFALWRIAQRKGWNVQLVTGTAYTKDDDSYAHAWLIVNGKIFDPVAYANQYRVHRYEADEGDPLPVIRDTFGVETDNEGLYSPDVGEQIKKLGLAESAQNELLHRFVALNFKPRMTVTQNVVCNDVDRVNGPQEVLPVAVVSYDTMQKYIVPREGGFLVPVPVTNNWQIYKLTPEQLEQIIKALEASPSDLDEFYRKVTETGAPWRQYYEAQADPDDPQDFVSNFVNKPWQPRPIPPPGQRPQFAVYARHEVTNDSSTKDMLRAGNNLKDLPKYKDVVIYADPEGKQPLATFGWWSDRKPNRRSKSVTLNCCTRPLYWIPDPVAEALADPDDPEAFIQRMPVTVDAICITDHMVYGERAQAKFNAADWFEQATLEDLIALAKQEFQSSYEADAVGEYFFDSQLKEWHENYSGDGFEVYISEDSAKRWVEQNRPDWYAYLWPDDLKEAVDPDDPETFVQRYTDSASPRVDAYLNLLHHIKNSSLYVSGRVTRHSHHDVHQYSTTFELEILDLPEEDSEKIEALANEVQALIQEECVSINGKIYRALEREWDHLNSDEAVDESIEANTYDFDEDGKRGGDFQLAQLSDEAKENARSWYREDGLNYDWWEYVIDEWKEELKGMGFDNVDISFSGFSSQGDGASFTGNHFDFVKWARWFMSSAPTERGHPYTDELFRDQP